MQYVRLGRTNLNVSRLCFGAMGIGSKSWRGWVLEKDEAAPVIRKTLDAGINFFDTCDFYSAGASETLLGELLVGSIPRDELVIATKVGNPMQKHPNGRGYSRKHVFEAIDASLRRLRTDHVDLYQTHIWDPTTDLDELVDAFADVVKSGKALYAAATTMPSWQFVSSVHRAKARQLPAFVSMQCEYNLCHREAERDLIPFCRSEGIGLIPFSPMARGFLSADRRTDETERVRTDDYTRKIYYRAGDYAVYERVAALAAKRGVSPSQIALAWTLAKPFITAPIFGVSRPEQVDGAVSALDIKLSPEEVAELEAMYPLRPLTAGGH